MRSHDNEIREHAKEIRDSVDAAGRCMCDEVEVRVRRGRVPYAMKSRQHPVAPNASDKKKNNEGKSRIW